MTNGSVRKGVETKQKPTQEENTWKYNLTSAKTQIFGQTSCHLCEQRPYPDSGQRGTPYSPKIHSNSLHKIH